MDEKSLAQIKLILLTEFDALNKAILERKTTIDSYVAVIQKAIASLDDLITKHKQQVTPLIIEKDQLVAEITSAKSDWAKEKVVLASSIDDAQKRLEDLNRDIVAKEERSRQLDNTIKGLMVEYHSSEDNLNVIRGQLSADQRRVTEQADKLAQLNKAFDSKKKELEIVSSEVETKKVEFSRLSEEITLLESRK